VRYDRPGCVRPGRTTRTDVVELELEVLHAVATRVGVDRFDRVSASFSAPIAVRWAAHTPSRAPVACRPGSLRLVVTMWLRRPRPSGGG